MCPTRSTHARNETLLFCICVGSVEFRLTLLPDDVHMRRVPTPVGHGQPTTALPHDYARSINDAPAPQVSPLKKRTQHEPQRPATIMTAPTPTPTPSASVQPRPIAPAPATDSATATPSTAPPTPPKVRKRDEHRRVTHNEVERRRRDKINHWIEKLGSIIPVDGKPGDLPLPGTGPMMFGTPFTVDAGHPEYSPSKGGILSKACDYVMALHKQVNT